MAGEGGRERENGEVKTEAEETQGPVGIYKLGEDLVVKGAGQFPQLHSPGGVQRGLKRKFKHQRTGFEREDQRKC